MLCASSPISHETSVFYGNSITDYRLHASSSCAGPAAMRSSISKKIRRANDESSSFCHTIYLTIKKRLASPLDDDDDNHPRRVPDRHSSTPTSKSSAFRSRRPRLFVVHASELLARVQYAHTHTCPSSIASLLSSRERESRVLGMYIYTYMD